MNLRVAIYARTSRTDQHLENQLIPLKKYADMQGWEYEIFTEQESTRKTRPVQWDLYNRCLKREFDIILIYKFDRWARSIVELVNHLKEFQDRGIRFVSFTENLDLGTTTGKLLFSVIAAMAEFERDLIRERTLAGLDRARAQGKKLGRPSKGKNYVKPSRSSVSELRGQDMTIRGIAKELKTSKYWVEIVLKELRDLSGRGGFTDES